MRPSYWLHPGIPLGDVVKQPVSIGTDRATQLEEFNNVQASLTGFYFRDERLRPTQPRR
jgi:hypothetical protein